MVDEFVRHEGVQQGLYRGIGCLRVDESCPLGPNHIFVGHDWACAQLA